MSKACRNCHKLYDDNVDKCPTCPEGSNLDLSERYNSTALIFDAERSEIAKKLGYKTPGKYAIKLK